MAETIKAKKVQRGHSIPGLDNAYIVDVVKGDYDMTFVFNDAEGGEGELVCDKNMPITVDQAEPQWVGGY